MNKPKKQSPRPFPHYGEIYLVYFNPKKGKEVGKLRPALVISNDIQNEYDEWVAVVPITTEDIKIIEPFEIFVRNTPKTGLDYPSKIQFIYPFTIDRERLKEYLGTTSRKIMEQAKRAWKIAFDVEEW